MSKVSQIRLPDAVGAELEKIAASKGLRFATLVKSILVEHLNENRPAVQPSTAQTAGCQPATG